MYLGLYNAMQLDKLAAEAIGAPSPWICGLFGALYPGCLGLAPADWLCLRVNTFVWGILYTAQSLYEKS